MGDKNGRKSLYGLHVQGDMTFVATFTNMPVGSRVIAGQQTHKHDYITAPFFPLQKEKVTNRQKPDPK